MVKNQVEKPEYLVKELLRLVGAESTKFLMDPSINGEGRSKWFHSGIKEEYSRLVI